MTPALHLTKIDPKANQFRFYRFSVARSLFGEWGLVREWGRIGSAGQVRTEWFETAQEVEAAQAKLERQKVRRGYGSD